jgi:hypothetical protein
MEARATAQRERREKRETSKVGSCQAKRAKQPLHGTIERKTFLAELPSHGYFVTLPNFIARAEELLTCDGAMCEKGSRSRESGPEVSNELIDYS